MAVSSHEVRTVGGWSGHIIRRMTHFICLTSFTLLFYCYLSQIRDFLHCSQHELAVLIAIVVIIIDGLRIAVGLIIVGQREHERRQVSSAAWSLLGLSLVFYYINVLGYALAIAASSAIVDPVIGELKRFFQVRWVYVVAIVMTFMIWFGCALFFKFDWRLAWLMAPLTVLAEYPRWKFLDDNFTMIVVPLLALIVIGLL